MQGVQIEIQSQTTFDCSYDQAYGYHAVRMQYLYKKIQLSQRVGDARQATQQWRLADVSGWLRGEGLLKGNFQTLKLFFFEDHTYTYYINQTYSVFKQMINMKFDIRTEIAEKVVNATVAATTETHAFLPGF